MHLTDVLKSDLREYFICVFVIQDLVNGSNFSLVCKQSLCTDNARLFMNLKAQESQFCIKLRFLYSTQSSMQWIKNSLLFSILFPTILAGNLLLQPLQLTDELKNVFFLFFCLGVIHGLVFELLSVGCA